MPWRVIAHGDEVWHVDAVAERRPNTDAWQLTLAFRAASTAAERRRFCAPYPIAAASKAALYIQAEQIPDSALAGVLAERFA